MLQEITLWVLKVVGGRFQMVLTYGVLDDEAQPCYHAVDVRKHFGLWYVK